MTDKASSTTVATNAYDCYGRGRRVEKVVGSDTTRFVYADQQCLEEYDGSDTLLRKFAFGRGLDEVVMMEAPDVADVDGDLNTTELKRFYFHTQLIGSVTQVSDPDEVVVESYDYGPYGETAIADINSSPVGGSQIGNPFMFTGRRLDEETGLYYYRARHYSPELGRFIQPDPQEYADAPNMYSYVTARVTSARDPRGLKGMRYYSKCKNKKTEAECLKCCAKTKASNVEYLEGALPGTIGRIISNAFDPNTDDVNAQTLQALLDQAGIDMSDAADAVAEAALSVIEEGATMTAESLAAALKSVSKKSAGSALAALFTTRNALRFLQIVVVDAIDDANAGIANQDEDEEECKRDCKKRFSDARSIEQSLGSGRLGADCAPQFGAVFGGLPTSLRREQLSLPVHRRRESSSAQSWF